MDTLQPPPSEATTNVGNFRAVQKYNIQKRFHPCFFIIGQKTVLNGQEKCDKNTVTLYFTFFSVTNKLLAVRYVPFGGEFLIFRNLTR